MSHATDQRLGHHLLFAVAHQPSVPQNREMCVSLVPLMDLDTGTILEALPHEFPGNGLVYWWNIPTGEWPPGSLVTGKLSRSPKHGGAYEYSWYQVGATDGKAASDEALEIIPVPLGPDESLRCLIEGDRTLDLKRHPPHRYCVATGNTITGPFRASLVDSSGTAFTCVPVNSANGLVTEFRGGDLDDWLENEGGCCEARISKNEHPAYDGRSRPSRYRYRLIRPTDLEEFADSRLPRILLTDEQIVSRACKYITGRSNSRAARDTLHELMAKVSADKSALENGLFEGLEDLIRRVDIDAEHLDSVCLALMKHPKIKVKLNQHAAEAVRQEVQRRVDNIKLSVREQTAQIAEEIDDRETELKAIDEQIAGKQQELETINKSLDEHDARLEGIISSARSRLAELQGGLLGELALLQPLFGHPQQSLQDGQQTGDIQVPRDVGSSTGSEQTDSLFCGPELTECEFIAKRLYPCLVRHGCRIIRPHAQIFHALLLSCRMLQVDHTGWAAGYCEAMGGTASAHSIVVDPRWMSFADAWQGQFEQIWRRATAQSGHLHLVTLDGLDRSPSHGWVRAWQHIIAGWQHQLPFPADCEWPANLRLLVTTEGSQESFPLPPDFSQWILTFSSADSEHSSETVLEDGHLNLDQLLLDTSEAVSHSDDGLSRIGLPSTDPWSPMYRQIVSRLGRVFKRMNEDGADDRIKWIFREQLMASMTESEMPR